MTIKYRLLYYNQPDKVFYREFYTLNMAKGFLGQYKSMYKDAWIDIRETEFDEPIQERR